MNQYEAVFIINPVLSDEEIRETVEKFKDLIEAKDGEILHEKNWGLRKLAYSIKHKRSGFYHLMEFRVPGEVIANIEVEMKRDERVMRFLTTRMDKHHIDFAQKRRGKIQNT